MSFESATIQENLPVEPILTFPPIASIWRRLGAWIVDILLLGLVGQIIGWTLSFVLFRIGPYGRLVGLLLTMTYFGLMNSYVGNGQPIGKRLFKIAVRDRNNKPLSLERSLLRISILSVPAMLNGWALPLFQISVLQWLLTIIVFGIGGTIFYTMFFNRRARQGLHDLICGTYVVHLTGKPIGSFPTTARIHLVISGVLVVLAVIGATAASFISSSFISARGLASVTKLHQTLQADNRFFTVSSNDNTLYTGQGGTIRSLQIQAWYKGVPTNNERTNIMKDIAKMVITNAENINQYDLLVINVTSAYDIGIATGHITFGDRQPIAVWQQRVNSSFP